MERVRVALDRLRRTPPRRLPGKLARAAFNRTRARYREWRLRHASAELSDRQLLRALGGRFPDTLTAVQHVRGRREPRFFVDPASARERAAAIKAELPAAAERTIAAAEMAVGHTVDLLGSGPTSLGPRIDWLADFRTGDRWEPGFYRDLDYHRLDSPCDVKMPWELSRCHHWVTLGRAYAQTGDPRYAQEFVAQLESWLDANPWLYSVNWGRAMEASVRAVNWLWALYLFRAAPEVSDVTVLRLVKSLVQHGRYIYENLERSDNNGNHYLSNGVGLLFLGLLLPECREASRWLALGEQIVWGELERQVYPDGVDFEKGLGYQGLVLEFWYSCLLLCELNGRAVPEHVRPRLARMFDFVQAYTRPDGTFPQIGDNDDGRLVGTDDEPVGSQRRHLAVGGVMFERPDLLGAAGDAVETAAWLLGPNVLRSPRRQHQPSSQAFPDGGFYILRAEDAVMVIDAGEVGMRGLGGHGHNDLLSFDLWAAGAPLLSDSGTYTYSADPAARQWFRSTAAHNTVRIDGAEIARLGGKRALWQIADDAHPRVLRWASSPDADHFEAEHDGYQRLPEPIIHRRVIDFDKAARRWLLRDHLVGSGAHTFELFFHVGSPELAMDVDDLLVCLAAPGGTLAILPRHAEGLTLAVEPGWISRGYGQREAAPVLRYVVRAAAPLVFETVLALLPVGTRPHAARELLGDAFAPRPAPAG